ncbi:MAG: hypothetical protein E7321_00090 [Clostridiales bacterium]|nr:hypothetical protein [Clostridiales bacterium]
MVISDKDAEVLRSVRRIYKELLQLREDLKEQRIIALHSPSMDGMPKGSSHADMMAEHMIRLDSMERRETELVRKLESARVKAYQVCRRIASVKARMFFEAYCADLQTKETAHKYSGADDQTVLSYLKMLKEDQ